MAVWSNTWSLGSQPTSFFAPSVGFTIQVVTVYNNSPAQLAFSELPQSQFPGLGIVVPAGYPMNIAVAGWKSLAWISDGTVPAAKSSLVVIANDNPLGLSTALSLFGPSGWGAGALPGVLTTVNVGDQITAANINQIINFLNGALPSQGALVNGGNAAGYIFADRDLVGNDFFEWYANLGIARLFTSTTSSDLLTIDEAGTVRGLVFFGIGATAEIRFADRDLAGGDYFSWYANAGLARLFSSVLAGDTMTIDEVGNVASVAGLTSGTNLNVNGTASIQGAATAQSFAGSSFLKTNIVSLFGNTGAPSNALGANGDFYFRSDGAAGTFIYHKAAGAWTAFV